MQGTFKRRIILALAVIFLFLAYIGIGFGVCSGSPEPTRLVAKATIDASSSPFSKEELVKGAVATQEYSFSTHDLDAYLNTILEMNTEAGTPYADVATSELLDAPDEYAIDREEISHLDDVYTISEKFFYPLIAIAVLAAFLLMVGYRYFGASFPSMALILSGSIGLALILGLVIWALVSFQTLFAVFHALLFAQGTWTFPADSLLITMLPEGFWVGIGAVWASISALLSLASLAVGVAVKLRLSSTGLQKPEANE